MSGPGVALTTPALADTPLTGADVADRTAEAFFWSKVEKSDGCWLWQGAVRNSDGYGSIRVNGHRVMTHRFSYELARGPIPDGLVVMHACDVTACVRPDHLSLGTPTDNNRDRMRKGRSATGDRHGFRLRPDLIPRGRANGKAKLTEESVRAIRASKERPDVLAARYGVAEDTARRIRNGSYRAWSWL